MNTISNSGLMLGRIRGVENTPRIRAENVWDTKESENLRLSAFAKK